MHRLGIVPQCLLREPLRVAALQSPFRPRIPIRVQRHTRNLQSITALTKLRCPVASPHGAKVWKQRSRRRTPFQDGLDFRAEANQRRLDANPAARLQFCPRIANRAAVPIHILRQQAGRVRLRRAGVPQQFVKIPPLRVLFPRHNRGMFLRRDGPLDLEHRLGPLQARDNRFKQPLHPQGVIVNAPQINIAGHLAIRQCTVEMFRAGFRHAQVADAVKIPVLDRRVPPPPRLIHFLCDDVFHHLLPGPRGQFGISAVEIHPRQRQVEVRLTLRFVVRLEDALRLRLVTRLEALLFAGDFVFEVEDASGTPDQTECLFHHFTHGYECEGIGICRVSEQWASVDRAETSFWTGSQTGEDSGETLTPNHHKTPINKGFRLEARVGIEPRHRLESANCLLEINGLQP
jgi:hypothetical protein